MARSGRVVRQQREAAPRGLAATPVAYEHRLLPRAAITRFSKWVDRLHKEGHIKADGDNAAILWGGREHERDDDAGGKWYAVSRLGNDRYGCLCCLEPLPHGGSRWPPPDDWASVTPHRHLVPLKLRTIELRLLLCTRCFKERVARPERGPL